MDGMTGALATFPVTVNSPQIENLALPPTYLEAVQEKERARENAEREKHKLEQQRLVALQAVKLGGSQREGETHRGRRRGLPGGDRSHRPRPMRSRLVTEQLGRSPQYVDLVRAKRWNGILPQTVLGEGVGASFLSMPAQAK